MPITVQVKVQENMEPNNLFETVLFLPKHSEHLCVCDWRCIAESCTHRLLWYAISAYHPLDYILCVCVC